MRGTGLDSPLWFPNWGRQRNDPPDVPPNARLPFWPIFRLPKMPTLDAEDKRWLLVAAGLAVAFALAATGPWG